MRHKLLTWVRQASTLESRSRFIPLNYLYVSLFLQSSSSTAFSPFNSTIIFFVKLLHFYSFHSGLLKRVQLITATKHSGTIIWVGNCYVSSTSWNGFSLIKIFQCIKPRHPLTLIDLTNLKLLFTWLVSETTTWSLTAVISWYIWIWSLHSRSSFLLALKGKSYQQSWNLNNTIS